MDAWYLGAGPDEVGLWHPAGHFVDRSNPGSGRGACESQAFEVTKGLNDLLASLADSKRSPYSRDRRPSGQHA